MRMTGTVTKTAPTGCEVTVFQTSACPAGCGHQCVGCSAARPFVVAADSSGWTLAAGDRVLLEHSAYHPLLMSALLFLLPLISGIVGYLLAHDAELGLHVLGAAGGFLLGFLPALWLNRRIRQSGQPTYRVIAVMDTLETE
ncbi:MAG: SoxR reducing system RseC family protein [Clostridia bacterium]|nr:SoxR reducing system RseC family protein [Clostridia bacterium]